jgi:hypothetical protein
VSATNLTVQRPDEGEYDALLLEAEPCCGGEIQIILAIEGHSLLETYWDEIGGAWIFDEGCVVSNGVKFVAADIEHFRCNIWQGPIPVRLQISYSSEGDLLLEALTPLFGGEDLESPADAEDEH